MDLEEAHHSNYKLVLCADIMLQMGFTQEEIQDSLVNQKYNDVMAAYLLLDYRNSEVHCFFLTPTHFHFAQHASYY